MNKKRLLTLAAHLRNEEARIHPKFNFAVVNSIHGQQTRKGVSDCGTAGCAMGELPAIWPRDFQFTNYGVNHLSYRGTPMLYNRLASLFFDITEEEALKLFSPRSLLYWWSGKQLTGSCSPEDVAESIERFVKWKEEQQ